MSNRIRVLIVEDQEFIRLGLTIALQKEARLDVVGTAADGLSAVSCAIDFSDYGLCRETNSRFHYHGERLFAQR